MSLTLAQMRLAKVETDPVLAGIIGVFSNNSTVLDRIRVETLAGTSQVTWNREASISGISGFRGLNASYTASETGLGTLEPKSEAYSILGGAFEVDRALMQMGGQAAVLNQWLMKQKAISRDFQKNFFKGATGGDNFTGLPERIDDAQTIETAADGDPLDLGHLDEAIVTLEGDNPYIFVNQSIYLKLQKHVRTNANINYIPDNFGRYILTYAGVPIVLAGKDTSNDEILAFDETQGESDVTCSAYVISLGEDGVVAAQPGEPQRYENSSNSNGNALRSYELDWLINYRISSPWNAIRIAGVTDAAVTDS